MPELPEVESVVRSLAPYVTGRRIRSAEFRCPRILCGDPDVMAAELAGRKIQKIARHGKFIVMHLSGGRFFTVHLGMTGRLLINGELKKHTHGIVQLDRGLLLYEDPRQFGRIEVSNSIPARVVRLGPEPLEISPEDFVERLRGRKTSIKARLLNQSFVRGVGNIYADESLFRAGIHPQTLCARIRKDRALKLHGAIQHVLREAINRGGTSISDYVNAEGAAGNFQHDLLVYGRTGEPCVRCGAPIRRIVVAQRGTHYCRRCQTR